MLQSYSYTLPDTDLCIHIASSLPFDCIHKITERYGLEPCRDPNAQPTTSRITITSGPEIPGLSEALAPLTPLEAVLCGHYIYVNDSRISHGNVILVEAINPSELPQTGLDVALTLSFAQQGAITLHACGFRYQGVDMLAFGPSKTGKSTLAAAVLRCGGQILSDDQLICHMDNGALRAHWLRKDMFLREGGIQVLTETLKQRTVPVQILGETRWKLDRRVHATGFIATLKPSALLFLQPPQPDHATPTVTRLNQALAFSELIRASSPALFGSSVVAIPALTQICRRLLTTTAAYQVTTTGQLLTQPQQELQRLLRAVNTHSSR